jgi:hypothetical protein
LSTDWARRFTYQLVPLLVTVETLDHLAVANLFDLSGTVARFGHEDVWIHATASCFFDPVLNGDEVEGNAFACHDSSNSRHAETLSLNTIA